MIGRPVSPVLAVDWSGDRACPCGAAALDPVGMQILTFAELAGMRWLRQKQSAINILVEGFRSGETGLRIRSRRRVRHIVLVTLHSFGAAFALVGVERT